MKKGLTNFILFGLIIFSTSHLSYSDEDFIITQDYEVFHITPVQCSTYKSSDLITLSAWKALERKKYKKAITLADDCIKIYSQKALKQQSRLTKPVDSGPDNVYRGDVFAQWALNDVATCYFINGLACRQLGRDEEAREKFLYISENLSYAQCWDSKGWFWRLDEGAKDKIVEMEKGVDFGDYTSESLTIKAWKALEAKEFEKVGIYVDKCIYLFEKTAILLQSGLSDFAPKSKEFEYWALNDVATCYFIKGLSLRRQGCESDAKEIFTSLAKKFRYAQCWDIKGWFWVPAEGVKDQFLEMEKGVDFGDYTSESLTVKAWKALEAKEFEKVDIYADKCIYLFEKTAILLQSGLSDFAPKNKEFEYWALNDVATCYFVKGLSLRQQGDKNAAKEIFTSLAKKFSYAQCWDIKGWFWKPSEGSKDQIVEMEKGVDFGDYTSGSLTIKAWKALEAKEFEKVGIYADKCIHLFEKTAILLQSGLSDFAPKSKEFEYWALNDVATCYFVKGLSLRQQGDKNAAKEIFTSLVKKFSYAQCWDIKGWFWVPAEGVKDQFIEMEKGVNFGNYKSEDLTAKAWNAWKLKKYEKVDIYTDKCITLFEKQAIEMQTDMTALVDPGKNLENKHNVFKKWALNDVATCYFIKGMVLKQQNRWKEAKKIFEYVAEQFKYAQCWDPKGWFWKPAEGSEDRIIEMEKGVNFGDYKSETLTVNAWKALETMDYEKVQIYTDKCIYLFEKNALDMQMNMMIPVNLERKREDKQEAFGKWALNDVATCYFIKGLVLRQQNRKEEAKELFNYVAKRFSYARCWDLRGWFWSVAQGVKNEIDSIDLNIDFGNYSSETLITKAWEALELRKYRDVEIYVKKCLELYEAMAEEMQAKLVKKDNYAPHGKEMDYWALNDVATGLFIMGKAYSFQEKNEEAKKIYNDIIDNYSYAQCWDNNGWFWKPAEGANDQIFLMDKGIYFGDYSSETLTTKAWDALKTKKYEEALIYGRKCIHLYSQTANDMQKELVKFASESKVFDYWALNDVGTCYFIIGEVYSCEEEHKKALEAFETLVKNYFYAQCWDPQGWFWKPVEEAEYRIRTILSEKRRKQTNNLAKLKEKKNGNKEAMNILYGDK